MNVHRDEHPNEAEHPTPGDYSFHFGLPGDGDLSGRWWWCLSLPGWIGTECSEGDFDTEDDARRDAERHLREEFEQTIAHIHEATPSAAELP